MTAPLLRYTAARIALFAFCYALLWLVGLREAPGFLAALLLSALLSAVLLKRLRDAIAASAEQRKAERAAARARLRSDSLGDAG